MIGLYYEDHEIGETHALGSRLFTREAIVAFARRFDPQPFHLDEAAGAASLLGSLSASGWHTMSVCMRLFVDFIDAERAAAAALGEPAPPAGLGAGARDLRWIEPVRPGDVIRYSVRVELLRETRRPQCGRVGFVMTGVNQEARQALSCSLEALTPRRGA